MELFIAALAFVYSVVGAYYWFYKHDTAMSVISLIGAFSLLIVGVRP